VKQKVIKMLTCFDIRFEEARSFRDPGQLALGGWESGLKRTLWKKKPASVTASREDGVSAGTRSGISNRGGDKDHERFLHRNNTSTLEKKVPGTNRVITTTTGPRPGPAHSSGLMPWKRHGCRLGKTGLSRGEERESSEKKIESCERRTSLPSRCRGVLGRQQHLRNGFCP